MKIVFLDADRVTLKKDEYFSERIARENNIPIEDVTAFYKNEFRMCQEGKADLKEELAKYLPLWKWDKGVEAFLDYWFTTDTVVNEALFVEVRKLRARGVKCYLVSGQEKYRAMYLLEQLDFKNKLDGCFFSYEIGFRKSQPEYFQAVLGKLGASPGDVVYWDNDQPSVDVAKELGIDARVYKNLEQFQEELQKLNLL